MNELIRELVKNVGSLIQKWDEELRDINCLIFHLGQIVNAVNWNDKDDVQKYVRDLKNKYARKLYR
jgi:molybdopterin converting factor small subunit